MITGVVLARDEELNIVGCLEALRPHVAELFLIDMESSDRTVELSRPYVDRILRHPLVLNFDAARNMAIPEATYEWLWFVDADEQVPAETGQLVNELVRTRGAEFEALTIPFKTFFCGHWMQHNGWWPGYTSSRVLKRGHFEFSRVLHGGVQVAGRELRFPPSPTTAIPHYSFRSLEHYVTKFNRYTTVEAKQLYEQGHRYDWRSAIRAMMQDLWLTYEHHSAWRDGTWGWIVSWQGAQYRWMSSAKLLDEMLARNDVVPESAPQSLAELFAVMEDELASFRRLKPQLPLGLVVHCDISELPYGSPSAATRLRALARLGRPMQWRQNTLQSGPNIDPLIDPVLWNLRHTRRPGHGLSIFIGGKTIPRPDARSVYSVYWPTVDTFLNAMTIKDAGGLGDFDSIWVSSAAELRRMRQLGVAEERLALVPPWLDASMFAPNGLAAQLDDSDDERVRLLVILPDDGAAFCECLLEAIPEPASGGTQPITLFLASPAGTRSQRLLEECVQTWRNRQTDPLIVERSDVRLIDCPADEESQAEIIRGVVGLIVASDEHEHLALAALACGRPVAMIGQVHSPVLHALGGCLGDPLEDTGVIEFSTTAGSSGCGAEHGDATQPTVDELRAGIENLLAETRSCPLWEVASSVQRTRGEATGREHLQQAIEKLEELLRPQDAPDIQSNQLRITLEGELFACHSFSNINEILAERLASDPSLAVRIERRFVHPVFDDSHPRAPFLKPLLNRQFELGSDVTIRHAFPPNWEPVEQGIWIHIQPWEFGYLPLDWLAPLRDHVTEIWAPSRYVRRVYVDSGIDENKVKVMPWGCDTEVFRSDAPPLLLPTSKQFRFVFVGGAIPRKGFDRLLEAYIAEFRREEDVCLVIKDMGGNSFYRDVARDEIYQALGDQTAPEVVYLHEQFVPSQLATLYAACHCLVAPYRGEGFGLPVLEAMACGLPAIVPAGGPTDDFVTDATGYRLPAREIAIPDKAGLCQTGLEFDVSLADLRSALRHAFENQNEVHERGQLASQEVRNNWTWDVAIRGMSERLWELAEIHLKNGSTVAKEPLSLGGKEELESIEATTDEIATGPASEANGSSRTADEPEGSLSVDAVSPSRVRRQCVLIQMANGLHKQLLDITRKHHEAYAARHAMDFWCLEENPAEPKRAGWGKITLLLRALREDYRHAIWLDADAVIMRPEVNFARICDRGMALVQHPNPIHWNTGFLIASNSPLVARFLAEVESQPDNDSAWMEQLALNELAKQPEYAAVLHPLPAAFNATPGAIIVPNPVIWAAHGLTFEKRVALLQSWVHEAEHSPSGNGSVASDWFSIHCREEFADHLNALGMTGSAVEIGVLRGEFSRMFLDRWKGEKLHLVDPWRNLENYFDVNNLSDEAHEQALAEVQRALKEHSGRYEFHRCLSAEAVEHFPDGSLDFVYLDANHEYGEVIKDLQRWYSKLRPGGVFAGHDYGEGLFPEGDFGVQFAVSEFARQTGLKATCTDEGRWPSWYLYRL